MYTLHESVQNYSLKHFAQTGGQGNWSVFVSVELGIGMIKLLVQELGRIPCDRLSLYRCKSGLPGT